MRIFAHLGFPLHAELAISSDGKWIAAYASTELKHIPFVEGDAFGGHSRIVVFDAMKGNIALQISKNTSVARDPILRFARDSNILLSILGPGRSHHERVEQKDELTAYCMDSTCARDASK